MVESITGEYRLTVLYDDDKKADEHAAEILKTLNLLRQFILGVSIHSSNGFEVTFLLPADQRENFPSLFQQLEKSTDQLGINTFGVSVTTMEEVFLR
ncbi:unnamed protein product [Onchocerca flexuosa]|uniref:DUF503 domain-containing protein n=1 Tax=Onchocerca flexuosa TaxID=387005 RepID=A0A183HXC7_9BILA|nr:unnamed protein product [Onchocerca flexuosa]